MLPPHAFFRGTKKASAEEKDEYRKGLCMDWAQAGYTQDKVLNAAAQTTSQIAEAFPDKYLGLVFVGGSQRFPTVNAAGKCTYPQKNTTGNTIIKQMVATYGKRAIFNETTLAAGGVGQPRILQWIISNGGNIAFQLNAVKVGCRNPKDPCAKQAFKNAVQEGFDAGAVFIHTNDGAGSFPTFTAYATGKSPVAVASGDAVMTATPRGPIPEFGGDDVPSFALEACPGLSIDYPKLYKSHHGRHPQNWLTVCMERVRTGYAGDSDIRSRGASGGVITAVLVYLLEQNLVDAVIAVRQGVPTPEEARAVVCRSREEVLACAQSVYIPVSVLDILREFRPGERYAMVCLPDQSAALRVLQQEGVAAARQVRYVVGPYTGTALYPAAIRALLRARGVRADDAITQLRWRAGEWPGYLEVQLASGRVERAKKVYYNYLIPFFVTQASLQSMDFANEFADLAVGDAWSPEFEREGGGHSVVVTRTPDMERVVRQMGADGLLVLRDEDPVKASDMHGHMLDFKKRGGYLRNRWRRLTGRRAPDYGYRPQQVPLSRVLVEVVISSLFALGRTSVLRWCAAHVPERITGPCFDRLRLTWKALSRPTKRKGLREFGVHCNEDVT